MTIEVGFSTCPKTDDNLLADFIKCPVDSSKGVSYASMAMWGQGGKLVFTSYVLSRGKLCFIDYVESRGKLYFT